MKKLVFLAIAAIFSTSTFAQSISLNKNSEVAVGTSVDEAITSVAVTNTTNSDLTVRVRRTVIQVLDNANAFFCWDLCFEPTVNISGDMVIPANGTNTSSFTSHLEPTAPVNGTAIVRYCFFNKTDQADSSCYEVTYNMGTVGVNDATAIKFTNPYPNPASDNVNFTYTLPNNAKGGIKIYNMLGALVKTATIVDATGKLTINTSDLRPGIYLYDLVVNNKSTKTGKFVVTQ